MKLSEGDELERPASMSRRKQLRPFKVQDDDDDDGDKSHDNGTNGANRPNSTDVNGLETTPNGNNADDETLHNTPESGKFNVCVSRCVRVRYQMLLTCFDEMRCDALSSQSIHMSFLFSISFSTSNRFLYSFEMKMYITLDSLFQEECLKFHCYIVFFFVFCSP